MDAFHVYEEGVFVIELKCAVVAGEFIRDHVYFQFVVWIIRMSKSVNFPHVKFIQSLLFEALQTTFTSECVRLFLNFVKMFAHVFLQNRWSDARNQANIALQLRHLVNVVLEFVYEEFLMEVEHGVAVVARKNSICCLLLRMHYPYTRSWFLLLGFCPLRFVDLRTDLFLDPILPHAGSLLAPFLLRTDMFLDPVVCRITQPANLNGRHLK